MQVYNVRYDNVHEGFSLLVVDNDKSLPVIKRELKSTVERYIRNHEEALHTCFGSSICEDYHNTIINDYTRLLNALAYTYTVNDLRDVDYLNVTSETVY